MPAWLCIAVAVVIVQFALGVGIGRAVRIADEHETPAGGAGTGKVPPARSAHLWIVR